MERDLKNQGYSKEDEYFHQLNQKLIKKLKEKEEHNKEKTNDSPTTSNP